MRWERTHTETTDEKRAKKRRGDHAHVRHRGRNLIIVRRASGVDEGRIRGGVDRQVVLLRDAADGRRRRRSPTPPLRGINIDAVRRHYRHMIIFPFPVLRDRALLLGMLLGGEDVEVVHRHLERRDLARSRELAARQRPDDAAVRELDPVFAAAVVAAYAVAADVVQREVVRADGQARFGDDGVVVALDRIALEIWLVRVGTPRQYDDGRGSLPGGGGGGSFLRLPP